MFLSNASAYYFLLRKGNLFLECEGNEQSGVVCLYLFTQHFISQREEFETARDSILVWLTEMDLQLTNIEHFSECDVQAKIKQLRVRKNIMFMYLNFFSVFSSLHHLKLEIELT